MALIVKDRVQETCSAPGTGTVSLLGAVTGFQTFSSAIGDTNTTFYTIADQTGANWEVGIGTYSSSGNTLARTTVLASSNGGSLTNFSSGTQNIWGDYPAGRAVYGNGTVLVAPSGALLQPSNGGTGQSNLPAAMAALQGFTTTATAAGTTTLTSASTFNQVFTGSTTQTIVLPVTSTLSQGWTYQVFNTSTGNLLVQSSGGNSILTVLPNTSAEFVCILTSGTTAASWSAFVDGFSSTTGTGSAVLANSPALLGSPTTPTPTLADSSTKIASTAFVQESLGGMAAVQYISTGTAFTLTNSYVGKIISIGANTTITISPTGWSNGQTVQIYGNGGIASLTCSGCSIVSYSTGTLSSLTVPAGSGVTLTFDGTNFIMQKNDIGNDYATSAPQVTVYTSGSGTYTVPSNCNYIQVELIGGGGGGAAPALSGAGNGSAGGNTTFGTAYGNGGGAGVVNDNGGTGGTAAIATGAVGVAFQGGYGNPNTNPSNGNMAGNGASSPFGGEGKGVGGSNYASGMAAASNTGSGGGGAGGSNGGALYAAGGGAAGGYAKFILEGLNLGTSYSWAVGAGGAGGTNGTVSGGAGAAGIIIVTAYF